MKARLTVAAVLFIASAIAGPRPAGPSAKKNGMDLGGKLAGCISILEKNHATVPGIIAEMNARTAAETRNNPARETARMLKTEEGTTVELIMQNWENGSWINSSRSITTFDDFHNQISRVDQAWENGAWVNANRMTNARDANGNLTETLFENWENGAWVKSAALLWTYDANGNETSFTMQADANEDGILDNSLKMTYTYNASNQMVEEDFSFWDSDSGDWMKTSRTEYTYDAQVNQVLELNYTVMGDFSLVDDRTVYTHDASGNILTQIHSTYDVLSDTLLDDSRSLYQYNTAGFEIEAIYQEWDGAAWINQERSATVFDPNGLDVEYLYQNWDNGWVNDYHALDSWDANGNYVHSLEQKWEGGAWVNEYQMESVYDAEDRITERIDRRWENGAWVNDYRYIYNWAVGVVRQAPAIPATFLFGNVPNPFNPHTTILFNLPAADRISVQVVDVQGQTVRTLIPGRAMPAGLNRIAWDGTDDSGSPVASGVYLYRISGTSFNGTGRCLLAR